ncbi:Cytoplasmic GTPase/eEF2-like protein (ribosomal biogenesis) [Cladochytrium tenue]|nr:Cytoplasmic GTPase/eEF2-like protein (ribosomal biogenesis) [Cladochytrium tenue]
MKPLYWSELKVEKLYLLMGRELRELDAVPAGNIFGIGGLAGKILKNGTLSSTLMCPSFARVKADPPILRVAVEPKNPKTGEHVIITAGELHLQDLRERFAKVEIQESPPIVPFRETLSAQPAINPRGFERAPAPSSSSTEEAADEASEEVEKDQAVLPSLSLGTVVATTPNKLATFQIRAVPIPKNVTDFLEASTARLSSLAEGMSIRARRRDALDNSAASADIDADERRGSQLNALLSDLAKEFELASKEGWGKAATHKRERRADPTVDQGSVAAADGDGAVDTPEMAESRWRDRSLRDYEASIQTGFQLATQAGPLCGEPVRGVAFFVEGFQLHLDQFDAKQVALLSGQLITSMRDACRQAFLRWSPRLALAMYSVDLQAPSDVLGKVYAVLARRRGRIMSEEMREGTPFFQIRALLPVVESFGFAEDLRKRTAGSASPQLIFSGYEVLDQDPFWVPTTKEELEDLGEKADRENLALKYANAVRKRKGMFVENKIVEHAEKQRTLKIK